MDRHAGRLIDYDQVFVFIYDGERKADRRNIQGTSSLLDKNLKMVSCGKLLLHIIMDAVYKDAPGHLLDLGQILGRVAAASEVLFYPQTGAGGINVIVDGTIHLHFPFKFGNIYYSIF